MSVKNRLKEIRMKEYMLDSKQFAANLQIADTTYCQYESGKSKPPLEKAFEIAYKLNKPITEIWYYEK